MVWAISLSTMKFIPHSLTPRFKVNGIHGLIGVDRILSHLVHPEPYLH
jgi:hypothetical protein